MAVFFIIQYSQAYIVTLGVDAVQGWEMDLVVLLGPFWIRIFCHSVIANIKIYSFEKKPYFKMCMHFVDN